MSGLLCKSFFAMYQSFEEYIRQPTNQARIRGYAYGLAAQGLSRGAQWAGEKIYNIGSDIISGRLSTPMSGNLRGSARTPSSLDSGRYSRGSASAHRFSGNLTRASQSRESNVAQNRLRGTQQNPSTPLTSLVYPAQLIQGRGAELAVNQMNIEMPIKFKTGEKTSRRTVDAFGREAQLYKSQSISMAFNFKAVLVPPSSLQVEFSLPINRFVCHNVFRHNALYTPNCTGPAESYYSPLDATWNSSLGPDKSFVRRQAPNGSAYDAFPAGTGLNTSFQTPCRYPKNGGTMFSRINRQVLENIGWNGNPIKMRAIEAGVSSSPQVVSLPVYGNSAFFTGAVQASRSIPNQCPINADVTNPADQNGPSFYYRSQQGVGTVAYTFNNDGLNPVIVDVVITRLKKNEALDDNGAGVGCIDQMIQSYENGYMNYALTNAGQADYSGETPQIVDVTTNQRGPFLPAKALGYAYKAATATDKTCVFKQVARDQFVLAGGGQRDWSMKLQALDYDARRYNQSKFFDDLTYIVSFGISGMPLPYVEQGVGGASNLTSIIDRRGGACNVNVVGVYAEKIMPVYMSRPSTHTYVNGRLDIPMYTTGTVANTSADIANLGQAIRDETTGSALLSVSPFNTQMGA